MWNFETWNFKSLNTIFRRKFAKYSTRDNDEAARLFLVAREWQWAKQTASNNSIDLFYYIFDIVCKLQFRGGKYGHELNSNDLEFVVSQNFTCDKSNEITARDLTIFLKFLVARVKNCD